MEVVSQRCLCLTAIAQVRGLGQRIAKRDVVGLLRMVAEDIRMDTSEFTSKANFRKHWNLDRPVTGGLWDELGQGVLLRLIWLVHFQKSFWPKSMR